MLQMHMHKYVCTYTCRYIGKWSYLDAEARQKWCFVHASIRKQSNSMITNLKHASEAGSIGWIFTAPSSLRRDRLLFLWVTVIIFRWLKLPKHSRPSAEPQTKQIVCSRGRGQQFYPEFALTVSSTAATKFVGQNRLAWNQSTIHHRRWPKTKSPQHLWWLFLLKDGGPRYKVQWKAWETERLDDWLSLGNR